MPLASPRKPKANRSELDSGDIKRLARNAGMTANACVASFVTNDRDELIIQSAEMIHQMFAIWQATGIDPVEVWGEMNKRLHLGNLMTELNQAPHRTRRQGKRAWNVTSTKLP